MSLLRTSVLAGMLLIRTAGSLLAAEESPPLASKGFRPDSTSAAVSPEGVVYVSNFGAWEEGKKGTPNIGRFDPATGTLELVAELPEGSSVEDVSWSGDGLLVVDGAGKRLVRIDPETGRVGDELALPEEAARPAGVAETPEGALYVSAPPDQIWHIAPDGESQLALEAFATRMAVSGDGKFLYTQSGAYEIGDDGKLRRNHRRILGIPRTSDEISYISDLEVGPDGRLWIARAGARTSPVYEHNLPRYDRQPGRLHVLAPDGKLLREVTLPASEPAAIVFAPDGSLYVLHRFDGIAHLPAETVNPGPAAD